MSKVNRLEEIIKRAYALAGQVLDDNRDEQVLQVLAEEVSGECGEFLAILSEDYGSFGDTKCMDPELIELSLKLKMQQAKIALQNLKHETLDKYGE